MRTPSAPFEPLHIRGESITLDTLGKFLVLPTGDPDVLSDFNEYTLTSGRDTLTNGTYIFTNDEDADTGLQNLIYPWIACFNPTSNEIDFYLFTHKPKNLECVISDVTIGACHFDTNDGETFTTTDEYYYDVRIIDNFITSLTLYPGNGLIYHGRITYSDLSQDTNNDLIPDGIKNNTGNFITQDGETFTTADGNYFDVISSDYGSVHNFLKYYGMVI